MVLANFANQALSFCTKGFAKALFNKKHRAISSLGAFFSHEK
jgi:hypothetical protein